MPKIPRTPQGQAQAQDAEPQPGTSGPDGQSKTGGVEAILAGMESRLAKKMDETKRTVQEVLTMAQMNSQAIEALEERVDDNREDMTKALRDLDEKLTARMDGQVKD